MMVLFFYLVVFGGAVIFITCLLDNEKEKEAAGDISPYNRKLKKFVSACDEKIRQNPHDAYLYFQRGKAKYNLCDFQGALDDYSHAIQLNPDDGDVYRARIQVIHMLDENSMALMDYTRLIELNYKDSAAYLGRAVIEKELNDYQSALEDLNEAIGLNPTFEAYLYRSEVKRALGDEDGARADEQKAKELEENK